MKKVLVGLTALLVVGLTVEHFVHAPSSARPNAATAIGHEPATTAPGLRLEGTALQPGDASGGGVSVPSRASVPEESIATTHELVGSIVLPEAVDATSTMLEVRGIPALGHKILSMTLAGTLAEDRRYRLDVSPLFAQGVELVEVDIKAEHSQCLPASTRALVSVARAPEGAPPGSPRQLRADLELHLAATVSGRVLDSVGAPRKGALVTLIPVPRADPAPATEPPADEAPPPPRPLSRAWSASPSDEALTDVEGRYRVRAGAKGEYLIVAAQPGLRPAVAQVELVPGVPYTAADLTLAEGETLEGQVLIDGEPAVGVTVSVWRRWQEGEDRGLSLQPLGAVTVGVVDGSADVDRVSVMTQTDGRFLATGLARAAYVAEPSLTSGGVRAHQSLMEQVRREVLVPGLPVRIEIGGARLDVHVTHEGRGVVRAEVAVTARGTFSLATDGEGHARLRIAPGMNHTIQVFARGLAPVERDLEVPADAEGRTFAVEIALEEARSKPGLRITLRTPDGTAVTSAAVRLSQRDPARPEGTHWQTLSRANLTASDGVFAWEGVPSGASVLHVLRAGGVAEAHYGQGFWLPVATEVEVPSEGYGTVTLDLRAGGRLRVAARSPDGRYLPAGCTLHDAEGAQVQVAFIEHLGGGMIARPSLGRSAPSLADPPVPAGRYTLRIEHEGFQTKSVEASVEAGKVTDMDVALAPK